MAVSLVIFIRFIVSLSTVLYRISPSHKAKLINLVKVLRTKLDMPRSDLPAWQTKHLLYSKNKHQIISL